MFGIISLSPILCDIPTKYFRPTSGLDRSPSTLEKGCHFCYHALLLPCRCNSRCISASSKTNAAAISCARLVVRTWDYADAPRAQVIRSWRWLRSYPRRHPSLHRRRRRRRRPRPPSRVSCPSPHNKAGPARTRPRSTTLWTAPPPRTCWRRASACATPRRPATTSRSGSRCQGAPAPRRGAASPPRATTSGRPTCHTTST